ncbi:MAG TPA: AbrB/MazE/SpoVT family DNA-binding domain-containing protein [Candidatus Nanoarchaeia archaeon]|nr:AbrB/MazE/SpoVT family DNA-binding domain-containing protein [Candidatus Nanoarchaeia archaeon]
MTKIETTSMSSRGQVVIPQAVRNMLHLSPGEKFIVLGEDDTIVFKRLEMPSFRGFDALVNKTRSFAKEKGITEQDIAEAVKRTRNQ